MNLHPTLHLYWHKYLKTNHMTHITNVNVYWTLGLAIVRHISPEKIAKKNLQHNFCKMPDFTEILQNTISLQQQTLPVCQNDLMMSYQHHVTSEQYVSISQTALIVYELADKISGKSAWNYWKLSVKCTKMLKIVIFCVTAQKLLILRKAVYFVVCVTAT